MNSSHESMTSMTDGWHHVCRWD